MKEEYKKDAEVEYDLKIEIKKEVEDQISWFTNNYEEEISAYLTGEIKEGVIKIDGLLFPHQDVSSGSVEVESKNLIKLRKEYGNECLRIIGHWHSHHNMGAFWSSTDDQFIKEYSRTKEISLFIVSSTKGNRIMVVSNKPFEIKLDNLDYDVIWNNQELENNLKKIIEDKVTKKTPSISWTYGGYRENTEQSTLNDVEEKETNRKIEDKITSSLEYSDLTGVITARGLSYEGVERLSVEMKREKPRVVTVQSGYEVIFTAKSKKDAKRLMKEIRFYLEEIFEEEINNETAFNEFGSYY